ncbi:MAG TPA: zinc-dependent peptidase, partial [Azonexus sp.]|nr:zinc-dependent peptidase [Azonexus sp.]
MIGLLDRLRGRKAPRIPDSLWAAIVTSMPFLDALGGDEQQRLRSLAESFLDSKEFTAAGGLQLTDEICVAIAAQGCLPILNLGLGAYRDWVGIIVYPDEFIVRRNIEDEDGVVHEYDDVLAGEAWAGGPLIVSWRDVK